jgi:uncharacterized protein
MEATGAPAEAVEQQVGFIRELVRLMRAEDYAAARSLARRQIEAQSASLPEGQRPTPEQVELQVDATVTPIYRAFMVHDPAPLLKALDIPVLAIFGGTDLQVPVEQNEPEMRTLLADNPDATIRTFPGLNHLMQPSEPGRLDEYGTIETTIDPQVLDLVRGWLTQRFPT